MTKPIDWVPTEGTHNFSEGQADRRYDFHLRNVQQITPNLIAAERCDATKVTPKSKWYTHLFAYQPDTTYDPVAGAYVANANGNVWQQIGGVRATRSWRGPGFKAQIWSWGPVTSKYSRWLEAFCETDTEASYVLINTGKGLWP